MRDDDPLALDRQRSQRIASAKRVLAEETRDAVPTPDQQKPSPWPNWLVPAGLAILISAAGYGVTQINQVALIQQALIDVRTQSAQGIADVRTSLATMQNSIVSFIERNNTAQGQLQLRIERAEEASKSVGSSIARVEQASRDNAQALMVLERAVAGLETKLERARGELEGNSKDRRAQSDAAERELRGGVAALERRLDEASKRSAEVDERLLIGLRNLNTQLQDLERRMYEGSPSPRRGTWEPDPAPLPRPNSLDLRETSHPTVRARAR